MTMTKILFGFFLLFITYCAQAEDKKIGVFVALADNVHQGIIPVPKAIGNGDDPERNLYWGTSEGLKGIFDKSKDWKLVEKTDDPQGVVLRTRIYKHARYSATLTAKAYQGSAIKQALQDFETAISNHTYDMVAFIGHNGLMDFQLAMPQNISNTTFKPATIVLACKSEPYFKERILMAGGQPVLLTTQLMYPGSFILHAAVNSWLAGDDIDAIHVSAGRSYAKNQKLSVKAGMGVFAKLTESSLELKIKK